MSRDIIDCMMNNKEGHLMVIVHVMWFYHVRIMTGLVWYCEECGPDKMSPRDKLSVPQYLHAIVFVILSLCIYSSKEVMNLRGEGQTSTRSIVRGHYIFYVILSESWKLTNYTVASLLKGIYPQLARLFGYFFVFKVNELRKCYNALRNYVWL